MTGEEKKAMEELNKMKELLDNINETLGRLDESMESFRSTMRDGFKTTLRKINKIEKKVDRIAAGKAEKLSNAV